MTTKIPSNGKCEICKKMIRDIKKHKEINICANCRNRTLRYFIREGFKITLSKPNKLHSPDKTNHPVGELRHPSLCIRSVLADNMR